MIEERIIRNVSDTALWVAVYRADESERGDAVFKDPFARRLAGTRGELVVSAMEDGRKNSWSFVARTHLFDRLLLEHLSQEFTAVLNLACGLDTRPYRLDLPSSLEWIDVDFPEIINYMNEQMQEEKPRCSVTRVALDLSRRSARLDLFQEINQQHPKVLVISEGLVGYLDADDNGALAYDLSHFRHFRVWILDLMSPGILPLINQEMGTLLTDAGVPLIFAPPEGEEFYRMFGWDPVTSYSKLKVASQLQRLPESLVPFAHLPEPVGPKGSIPWSGVCVLKNRLPILD